MNDITADILSQIYSLSQDQSNDRPALKILFREVNDLLHAGRFDLIDEIIQKIDSGQVPLTISIGLLRVTGAVRTYLSEWKPLLGRVQSLKECVDDPSILVGLTESPC